MAEPLMLGTDGLQRRRAKETAIAKRMVEADTPTIFGFTAAQIAALPVDKLDHMLQMQERIRNEDERKAFNEAMNAAQSEMGRISTDASNPQTRSRYASYGQLDKALRPIYSRHGFAVSFNTGDGPDQHVRVLATVTRGGHERSYQADIPCDGKGPKGNDVMSKTHAAGSAMTYGQRYLLKLIFNVAIGENDDDGNGAAAPQAPNAREPITAEQLAELIKLADDVGADKGRFCKYVGVQSFAEITSGKFAEAKRLLNSKRRK